MKPVLDIWLEASVLAHDFIKREYWESKLNDIWDFYLPASETYVFEEDDAVRGFLSLFENTVAALFVSPAFQGKGIGIQLINKAKALRETLELSVYKKNGKSFEFYQRCGFTAAGERVDERTGEEEILMRW